LASELGKMYCYVKGSILVTTCYSVVVYVRSLSEIPMTVFTTDLVIGPRWP